jgi:ethanolamine utilization protein EutQ
MKTLISAADIRRVKSEHKTYIVAPVKGFIVTPEARDLAGTNDIAILEHEVETQVNPVSLSAKVTETPTPITPTTAQSIQAEIEARLPNVDGSQSDLIQSLVAKAMANFDTKAPASPRQINDDGIVMIRGNAVELEVFDGAPSKNVGLTDVLGAADGSNMGVGYMGWENAFFPWTLNYDEVNVVLEGELHVKTASSTTIGKPGDVVFIPKGSSVEFGTPTHVRYVYVTYPAEWS